MLINVKLLTNKRLLISLMSIFLLAGCSMVTYMHLNDRYGKPSPQNRVVSSNEVNASTVYYQDIKPILDKRCVVCHACYDAPCQLKLNSFAGIDRGASKQTVYNGERLVAITPNRLFIDADTTKEWRERDFYPVLNERQQSTKANIEGSLIARLLQQKQKHPLPTDSILPNSFDFNLNRDEQCPKIEEHDQYKLDKPLWGMPYAMPQLTKEEHNTLLSWIEQGAKAQKRPALTKDLIAQINQWEIFLNGNSLKQQLVNRYIYEHLFLANLYFDNVSQSQFFKLVRSYTPPGEAIKIVATSRPFDNPFIEKYASNTRIYYRLQAVEQTIVAKTHMPYALNADRKKRWEQLFYQPTYTVEKLPSYDTKLASNPFRTFHQLPLRSRYEFMLDEAQFTIMGFIKGPVCRGQIALNVIHDHFWVTFIDPSRTEQLYDSNFLYEQRNHLTMPAALDSNALPLIDWLDFSQQQIAWLKAKKQHINERTNKSEGLNLDMLWDGGNSNNNNAALTIFRHFDSATVTKGLVGQQPKTSWVIGYPLLERIHYLLVAGFDVYGNIGHQLYTRMYMDFLRMEGEFNFVSFLPEDIRYKEHKSWYHDVDTNTMDYLLVMHEHLLAASKVSYNKPGKKELNQLIKNRVSNASPNQYALARAPLSEEIISQLDKINSIKGKGTSFFPENSLVSIVDKKGTWHVFTLLHHNAHANVSSLFNEKGRRLPREDYLTIAYGVVGTYPNTFYHLNEDEIGSFVEGVDNIRTEADIISLNNRFAIRRTQEHFWIYSDNIHKAYQEWAGIEYGLLDYNRIKNQ